jgi:hypothetical protein
MQPLARALQRLGVLVLSGVELGRRFGMHVRREPDGHLHVKEHSA